MQACGVPTGEFEGPSHVADVVWRQGLPVPGWHCWPQGHAELGEGLPGSELTDKLLSSAPVGLALLDRDLRYLRVNEWLAHLNGLTVAEHIGRRIHEVLVPAVADLTARCAYEVLHTARPVLNVELSEDGVMWPSQHRHWLVDFYPVHNSAGEVMGVGVVEVEITERKRTEDELERQKEAAEAGSRAKDQFLAMLSHELRTPLTPVLTTVLALQEEAGHSAETRSAVEMIRRNVEVETRLIDDLLDVTRIVRGKLQLHPQPLCAHEAVQRAVAICREGAEAKRQELTMDLRAQRRFVMADPARLQQVLWNLINNAIKFTPEGGRVTVRTWNEPRDSAADGLNPWLVIEVRDTGIGMTPEQLARVFGAFEQGGPAILQRFGGLGLGLAITKALVEGHEGTIGASSEGPGQGAQFVVKWPTIEPPAPLPSEAKPNLAGRKQLRILLVDDHADTLRSMRRLLQQLGHEVISAESLAMARELGEQEEFDLLISDIGLPDGSGLDLPRGLKAKRPFRSVALSGYGMEEDVKRSQEAGFAAHLTKPVDLRTLEQVIAEVMGQQ